MVSFTYLRPAIAASLLLDISSASCAHGTHLARRSTYSTLNARNELEKRVDVSTFGYHGLTGPTNWDALDPANSACSAGRTQSPIDLTGGSVKTIAGNTLNITMSDVATTELENLGSTVEVIMAGKGASITIDGKTFNMAQYHFHTPSEHTIDGEYFPLEMHMVHQAADSSISVLAVPFQLSTDGSTTETVTASMAGLAEITTPGTLTEVTALPLSKLATALSAQTFSTYSGSLTTPPCTEGITFYVATKPMAMDVATYNSIKAVVGFNSRFVQNAPGGVNVLASSRSMKSKKTKKTKAEVAKPYGGQ
ncbi:hypothetical protein BP5796_06771 [Coleophoma crateriformis]|uniref:Carbonic anhydrase n=1 Tax=Coleophoma crateriformis TaxID=565419 RepID=A0A3D8RPQ3_9HELO|nr:hypothetical protein BP5796_06771 [Coleophoma crateriformis]